MNGLDMLDVAIGTIFVFLLLSLICTAVNEIIESILKRRATELERGIGELLSKQGAVDYGNIVAAIYNHPLISSLYKGADYKTAKENNDLPSYIPTRNFALALLDIVTPVNKEAAEKQQHLPPGNAESFSPDLDTNQVTQPAPSTDSALAGNQATTTTTTTPVPDSAIYKGHTLDTVHKTVDQIKNDTIKRGLLPLIDAAENDVDRLRANIEDWYNSTMDRVSGWYKRRTQWIMIALGLAVAIIVNADTISIVDSLTHDPAARASLISATQEFAKTEADATSKDGVAAEAVKAKLDRNLAEIKSLGLPIGWNPGDSRSVPLTGFGWLLKGLGWLITATAISLGAPFWFDVLNKFMVVRSTVKPKEKSKEEGQKDAKK